MTLAELDGTTVSARAFGWDGHESDGTEWALDRSDLPRLTTLTGTLTVTYVNDLDYTAYVVNGIPVDPATVRRVDYSDFEVLVAGAWGDRAQFRDDGTQARDKYGQWTSGLDGGEPINGRQTRVPDTPHTEIPGQVDIFTEIPPVPPGKMGPNLGPTKAQQAGYKAAATKQKNAEVAAKAAAEAVEQAAAVKHAKQVEAGHKAAATKKANADAAAADLLASEQAKADLLKEMLPKSHQEAVDQVKAEQAAKQHVSFEELQASKTELADSLIAKATDGSAYGAYAIPTGTTLEFASPASITNYLKTTGIKPSKYEYLSSSERRDLAKTLAVQHTADVGLLTDLGYGEKHLVGNANEARRAVLRETGERKPTGGPNTSGEHVFYGAQAIKDLPRDKQEAILLHHSGGTLTKAWVKIGYSDADVTSKAIQLDETYKQNVEVLLQNHDASTIPHSRMSTMAMMFDKSKGLPLKAKAAPVVTTTSNSEPAGNPIGTPANWNTLTPAKQKAWVKKQYEATKSAAHPVGYDTWGAGKKAGWSKKYNLNVKGIYPPTGTGTHPTAEHTTQTFTATYKAADAYHGDVLASPTPDENQSAHDQRVKAFHQALNDNQRAALSDYTGNGYKHMNRCAKYGKDCSASVEKKIAALESSFAHGTPAPKVLYRGKSQGPMKDLKYNVGDEYVEPGFGSFSTGTSTPAGMFADTSNDWHTHKSVITRVVDSKHVISIPGTSGEGETIMPRNTRYRVLAIHDYIVPGETGMRRIIDVEVIL